MKFYIYNFMKKYTLNFTTTTVQGTKKIPPRKTRAGSMCRRPRWSRSAGPDHPDDRSHRL